MTIPSAAFTINGTPVPAAVQVAYSAAVPLALVSTSGVVSVAWSIVGASEDGLATPTIVPSGVPLGATATLTMIADPTGGRGAGFHLCCTVTDSLGKAYRAYGVFGAYSAVSEIPVALGETVSRDAVYGWLEALNRGGTASRVLAQGNASVDFPAILAGYSDETTVTAGSGLLATDKVDVWLGGTEVGDNIILTGYVVGTTQVSLVVHNVSTSTIDLGSKTFYYRVTR